MVLMAAGEGPVSEWDVFFAMFFRECSKMPALWTPADI